MFEPIKTRRTASSIVEQVEDRILDGTFSAGELLPSEEQLAITFGVGRRAVREALKVLETRGLVETRMGVGTVVQRNDLDNFLSALARNITTYVRIDRADVGHVAELRSLLELAALRRAAATRNSDLLDQLAEAVEEQRKAHAIADYHSYQDWHFLFHYAIVDALDNPVISMLYKQVLALMRGSMEKTGRDPEVTVRAIEEHALIVNAISQGDIDQLPVLLNDHLQNSVRNIQNAIERDAAEDIAD